MDTTQTMDRRVWKGAMRAYCGEKPSTKKGDHVVPTCLFTEPRPSMMAMLVVPACRECNEAKARNDSVLRDILVTHPQAFHNPARVQPFEKMVRAVQGNKSASVRIVEPDAWVAAPTGLYRGPIIRLSVEWARVEALLMQMVRGLYFYALRERLPTDCDFVVAELDPYDVEEMESHFRRDGCVRIPIGDGSVFDSLSVVDADDPRVTRWLLRFFGGIFFTVFTDPPHRE